GRRGQAKDRYNLRPGARRHGRAGADHRSRSAGQCLDRARHRPPQSSPLDLRCVDGRGHLVRCGAGDRRSTPVHRAVDTRSLRPRARSQPGARPRVSIAHRARAAAPRVSDFSYVLIDCPPSLNLLTVNALAAADAILVPLQCEFFALEGLSQLLQTVATVKSTLNPELMIHGIVLTMHDARNNLSNQVVADVRANSKQKVYDTIIPRNVRVSEAPSYGKPVLVYDLKCVGSEAYLRLATEIIQREKELIANAPRADAAIESDQIESDQQHGAA